MSAAPRWHVGDSDFESWFASYDPAGKGDKQRARDAYAAGMGEWPATAEFDIEKEREAFEAHLRSLGRKDHELARHVENVTWFGNVMPDYRDRWTQALWTGWKMRANRVVA